MRKLLAIDLSSSKTGYAVFNMSDKELLDCGVCIPKSNRFKYPYSSLMNMRSMANDVESLIKEHNPDYIIMEEVIRSGKSSVISQKVLDGTHFVVLDVIAEYFPNLEKVYLYPPTWWRSKLEISLKGKDRMGNKLAKTNKKVKKVTYKDLSVRWVMANYPKFEISKSDHDACDAVCLGSAFLR